MRPPRSVTAMQRDARARHQLVAGFKALMDTYLSDVCPGLMTATPKEPYTNKVGIGEVGPEETSAKEINIKGVTEAGAIDGADTKGSSTNEVNRLSNVLDLREQVASVSAQVIQAGMQLRNQLDALLVAASADIVDAYLGAELEHEYYRAQRSGQDLGDPKTENELTERALTGASHLATQEIMCLSGAGRYMAAQLVDTALVMGNMPQTSALFINGLTGLTHMDQVCKGVEDLSPDVLARIDESMSAFLDTSAEPGRTRTKHAVRKQVQHLRATWGMENFEQRRRRGLTQRCVWVENQQDGIATLSAVLAAEDAWAIHNTVTDIALSAKKAHDPRTLTQLKADALVHLWLANPASMDQLVGKVSGAPSQSGGGKVRGTTPSSVSAQAPPPGLQFPESRPQPQSLQPSGPQLPALQVPEPHSQLPSRQPSAVRAPSVNQPLVADERSRPRVRTAGYPSSAPTVELDPSHPPGVNLAEPEVLPEVSPHSGEGKLGVGMRAVIHVYVPAATLSGESDTPGVLAGHGPLPASVVRRLAAQADTLYRVLTDPATGKPLGQGRKSYQVSEQTRQYLMLLSETCEFPGCTVSSRRTDADHIHPWDQGGPTDPVNLQLLCRTHHNLKTKYGWSVQQTPDGVALWTSPLGNIYSTEKHPILQPEHLTATSRSEEGAKDAKTTIEDPPF